MKKIILILLTLCFTSPLFAYEVDLTKAGKYESKITEIGYNLLNANRIPYKITFFVKSTKKMPNAFATVRDNSIVVYSTMVKYVDDENQLAAVLAHEISHAVDNRQGVLKGYFTAIPTSLNPKKYEYRADKRGVDYMVKAGYNPIGMIILLNRIAPDERYDIFSTHPTTSKRLANIYEYIYTKYPQYLVQNEYKNNIVYQNFLLTSKNNRKKLEEKINKNSNKKVNYI